MAGSSPAMTAEGAVGGYSAAARAVPAVAK